MRRKFSWAVIAFGLCFDVATYGGEAALAFHAHLANEARHASKETRPQPPTTHCKIR
jgi:hypothetical protein